MNEGNVFSRLAIKSFLFIFIITGISVCRILLTEATTIQNNCVNCHQRLQDNLALYAQQWADSVHAAFSVCCEDCHGGDPNSPYKPEIGENSYIGVPVKRKIPYFCDRCHANPLYMKNYNIRVDREDQYKDSIHGQRLLKEGNMDVADCVNCHGSHNIKITDDSNSKVNHFSIAETCAKCHSDNKLMKPYGIPTDQFVQYKKSSHGQILYQKIKGKNPRFAPSCPGCHGIHGGKPSGVAKVADACYNCHLMTKRYFQESVHGLVLNENQHPQCIDCHGYHNIPLADEEMFVGHDVSNCAGCHSLDSKEYQNGQTIRILLIDAQVAVKKSQSKIRRVKKDLDIDISGFDQKMRDVFDYFGEAKSAIHSQDIRKVKEIVKKIHTYTRSLNQQVDGRYREMRQRKKWLVQMLLYISFLFFFVAYQRSKLNK